jgi:hypothetical protein
VFSIALSPLSAFFQEKQDESETEIGPFYVRGPSAFVRTVTIVFWPKTWMNAILSENFKKANYLFIVKKAL